MYRSSLGAPNVSAPTVAPLSRIEWLVYLFNVVAATLALAWKGWAISQLYRRGNELSGALPFFLQRLLSKAQLRYPASCVVCVRDPCTGRRDPAVLQAHTTLAQAGCSPSATI